MNEIRKLYGAISKTEELGDGTIKVWGFASSEAVDSDGETITADAMKAALPDYMKFGAVREMHQPKAAGTAIEAEVQDDGRTWFGAHVVDSEAVKKVRSGVYKGFSIGGKVTGRDDLNKTVITGLRLVEVSLVDRPANPEAVLTMYKSETLDEEDKPQGVSAVDALAVMLNKGEISAEKLLELAKGQENGTSSPANEAGNTEATAEETLKKSMWSVQEFASVISSLGWICQDVQAETEWEGDNSPIPAQLRAWFASGVQIFKDMAAEETAELLAQLKAQAGDIDVIAMAARGSDLAKAGAKFSSATKAALKAAHDACKAADKALANLGYEADDDEEGEGEKAASTDDLAKVAGELDVTKAALTKATDDLNKAEARIKELEAQPAPGKALLKAIAKTADAGSVGTETAGEVAKVTDARGEVNEVASLIKSIHSGKA